MKSRSICFCIRGRNRKSKENEVEDSEKLSHGPCHKGKIKGYASTAPGDGNDGGNVHGATTTTVAGNDAGVVAAVVTAAHVSLMSANEGGTGSTHGGDSGDGGG